MLDIDTLAAYQDRGDDCLLVLYDPARRELQKYRLCNGLLEWWHKGSPYTLEGAKRAAEREERGLTLDQLHFIEVGGYPMLIDGVLMNCLTLSQGTVRSNVSAGPQETGAETAFSR